MRMYTLTFLYIIQYTNIHGPANKAQTLRLCILPDICELMLSLDTNILESAQYMGYACVYPDTCLHITVQAYMKHELCVCIH